MSAAWPITWPETDHPNSADPKLVAQAEELATAAMRFLTLNRVGGLPITVAPCGSGCRSIHYYGMPGSEHPDWVHPYLMPNGMYGNCLCGSGCTCEREVGIELHGPVGRIDSVTIGGVTVPESSYFLIGNRLIRPGSSWPSCGGGMLVTYLNAYPVDSLGKYAGGVLALEYLRAMNKDPKCRLPRSVRSMSRQGVSMEFTVGMFPEGTTGLPEVDTYLMQWNPGGLKQAPAIYSPDMHVPFSRLNSPTL